LRDVGRVFLPPAATNNPSLRTAGAPFIAREGKGGRAFVEEDSRWFAAPPGSRGRTCALQSSAARTAAAWRSSVLRALRRGTRLLGAGRWGRGVRGFGGAETGERPPFSRVLPSSPLDSWPETPLLHSPWLRRPIPTRDPPNTKDRRSPRADAHGRKREETDRFSGRSGRLGLIEDHVGRDVGRQSLAWVFDFGSGAPFSENPRPP